ncbi:hypothetical protein SSX86_009810 [Deinandra increscens subsp. villosa]|uniref:Uncharacterized protein n=1 Tax=Deinandra increscens subsp. villosa TaxID=3103831 RepID=A0AAP0DEG3_9ASTR
MGGIKQDQIIQSTQIQWVFGEIKNNATSLTPSSPLLFDDGPLYELSELMAHLPMKRGLSKYYQGKSESFGSLANLKNIEDLAKKGSQKSRRSKFRGYGGRQSQILSPKGTIVKNNKCCSSSILSRSCLVSSHREIGSILDAIVVQKRF